MQVQVPYFDNQNMQFFSPVLVNHVLLCDFLHIYTDLCIHHEKARYTAILDEPVNWLSLGSPWKQKHVLAGRMHACALPVAVDASVFALK